MFSNQGGNKNLFIKLKFIKKITPLPAPGGDVPLHFPPPAGLSLPQLPPAPPTWSPSLFLPPYTLCSLEVFLLGRIPAGRKAKPWFVTPFFLQHFFWWILQQLDFWCILLYCQLNCAWHFFFFCTRRIKFDWMLDHAKNDFFLKIF